MAGTVALARWRRGRLSPKQDGRPPHAAARASLWPWQRWLSALVSLALSAGVSVAVLAVVAFGLRLWHFRDIPRYADEINEIMPAFGIVRGDSFPPEVTTLWKVIYTTGYAQQRIDHHL